MLAHCCPPAILRAEVSSVYQREVVFTATGTEAVNTAVWGALRDEGRTVPATSSPRRSSTRRYSTPSHAVATTRPSSASTGTVGSTRRRSSPPSATTRCWCRCSSPTTRWARSSRPVEVIAGVRERSGDAVVHVDACAAAGHVPVDFAVLGRRPLLGDRAHLRRAQGCGRAARAARPAVPAVRGGRRAGAGPARRHRERARDRRLRRGVRRGHRRRRGARARARRPTWPRARSGASTASSATAIPTHASPTSCAWASTASRPSRSCSRSTSEASPCTRDRRARASRSNRRRCSQAMGVDADRSLRASVGWSSTDDDVDAFLDALPVVVGLLRDASVGKLRAMTTQNWPALAAALTDTLHLRAPPLAITFSDAPLDGVPMFDEPMPAPLPDGRTGRVPAGCVFWMKAAERTFGTVAEDHGNCSVGSVTHGFKTLDEVGRQLRRRRAARVGLGHDGRRAADPGRAREAGRGHLRAAGRDAGRPRRRVPARQRPSADGALRRDPRPAHRGQAAVPHRGASPRRRACPRPASAAR